VLLTPKTARNARELHTALREHFGNNARGESCITYVDYDRHPDRLHITFALDDADPAAKAARPAALKRIRDLLEAVHDGNMMWTWVLVTGTAATNDRSGAVSESMVIRAQFSRDKLAKVDWPHAAGDEVPRLAEHYWLCLDLQK
jgi:hypothetical protein